MFMLILRHVDAYECPRFLDICGRRFRLAFLSLAAGPFLSLSTLVRVILAFYILMQIFRNSFRDLGLPNTRASQKEHNKRTVGVDPSAFAKTYC